MLLAEVPIVKPQLQKVFHNYYPRNKSFFIYFNVNCCFQT
jgi:hypothetical protein